MNESRDKFLTEWMGQCWHEWKCGVPYDYAKTRCKYCGESPMNNVNLDFSTWPGFGILWKAMKEDKERWEEFISLGPDIYISATGSAMCPALIPIHLIDPDTLATKVAMFLGWKEEE